MFLAVIGAQVLAAAALCAALLALGSRLRGWLRVPVGPALRWPVDLQLGAWAAAVVLLGVGLLGAVGAVPLLATPVAAAAAGRWRGNRRPTAPVLAAAVAGAVVLPVAAGPPFFYDAMVYHLGLPWQALVEGGWQPHPENIFATFPPLPQLLAMPALACGLYRVPALLHWATWVAVAAAVWSLARRGGAGRLPSLFAAAASIVLPVAPLVAGFPAAEGWLLVGLIPAFALALCADRPGGAAMAGLLAGAATASRLQGIPWSAWLLLVVAVRSRGRPRALAAAAGMWLLGALPWWLKNLVLLGDPLAPLGWDRPGLDSLWRDSQSLLYRGASPLECLAALPRLLAPETAWLAPLALAAVLAVLGRRRSLVVAASVLFGATSWACTGALPRFLAPTVALLLVLAASASRGSVVRWAATAAIAWAAGVGVARDLGWLQRIDIGHVVTLDFREAGRLVSPNDPMAAFADARRLPDSARVLFVGEARGFSFPRPFTATSQHDVSPLQPIVAAAASSSEIADALKSRGISHVLINWPELRRLNPSYPVAPWHTPEEGQRWADFVRAAQPPVVERSGVQILRVPGSSALEPNG